MDGKLLILGLADIKGEEERLLRILFEGFIQPDGCGKTTWDGSAPCVCGVRWEVMGSGASCWTEIVGSRRRGAYCF